MAKQHRTPFYKSIVQTKNLFDLVYFDLWGLYNTPTTTSYKYFLTVVDDKSRSVWTIFSHATSSVHKVLRQFFLMVQSDFKTKVKTTRTDNRLVFVNLNCQRLFHSHGIFH